ncbi:MAG: CDP-alcohol phosphatidyltransferase family protein [Gemmatimonadota bacterium]
MEPRPFTLRERRVVTPPNLLSLLRVAMLPPSLLALHRQDEWGLAPVVLTLGIGLGTDALDGLLARWQDWISDLGRVLDPVADKLFLGGVVLYLALERDFPAWLVALVVARDLTLVAGSALLLRRYRVAFAANAWGKASTVLLSLLVVAHVVRAGWWIPWLTAGALVTVVVSTALYARDGWRYVSRERAAIAGRRETA